MSNIDLLKQNLVQMKTNIEAKGGTVSIASGHTNPSPAEITAGITTIPTEITPTGSISITSNGTYNVTNYASAIVGISSGNCNVTQTTSGSNCHLNIDFLNVSRQIDAGTYQFNSTLNDLTELQTQTSNIIMSSSGAHVVEINYSNNPLTGITTDNYILAVKRQYESQAYCAYAYQTTVITIQGLGTQTVNQGWYYFNMSTYQAEPISAIDVTFDASSVLSASLTTARANSMFTTNPVSVSGIPIDISKVVESISVNGISMTVGNNA